jgi:hypothetical protein
MFPPLIDIVKLYLIQERFVKKITPLLLPSFFSKFTKKLDFACGLPLRI